MSVAANIEWFDGGKRSQTLLGICLAVAVCVAWLSYVFVGRMVLVAAGLCTVPFFIALFRFPFLGACVVAFLITAMPTFVRPTIPTLVLLLTLLAMVANKLSTGRLVWRFTPFAGWTILLIVWLITTILWLSSYNHLRFGIHYVALLIVLVFVDVVRTPKQFLAIAVVTGVGMIFTWCTTLYGLYTMLTSGMVSQIFARTSDVGNSRFYGFWNNPNPMAYSMMPFVALSIGFLSYVKSRSLKLLLGGSAVAGFVTILMSLSRGAILATAVVIFIFALRSKHRNRLLLALTIIVSLSTILLPSNAFRRIGTLVHGRGDASVSERSVLAEAGIQISERGFPFGTGIGSSVSLSPKYALHRMSDAQIHNSYLDLMAEGGIVAFLLFWGMMGSLFVAIRKTNHKASGHDSLPEGLRFALGAALVGILIGFTFEDVIGFHAYWLFFTLLSIAPSIFSKEGVADSTQERRALAPNSLL